MRSSRLWPGSCSITRSTLRSIETCTLRDVAELGVVGDRADRPVLRLQNLDLDPGMIRQKRSAPAARAEGGDRRQRQKGRVEGQNRAADREVVGGRSGGRRDQDAVGDQLRHAHLRIDAHAQLAPPDRSAAASTTSLMARAVWAIAVHVPGHHQQRVHDAASAALQPFEQIRPPGLVHQEADRALVHAVDRLGRAHEPVQASAASGRRRRAPRSRRPARERRSHSGPAGSSARPARQARRWRRMPHAVETAGHAQLPSWRPIGCGGQA